jgi:hypothetical protein
MRKEWLRARCVPCSVSLVISRRSGRRVRVALGLRLAVLCAAVLPGCVSTEPRMTLPINMEANCEKRAVKQTAIDSIVASTDDAPQSALYPGDAALRATIAQVGGVFAYWHDQPLKLPHTAASLGVTGDYLQLERAVITNDIHAGSRPIWLTVKTPHGPQTVLARAYDLQDVCIEGARDI